MFSPDSKIMTVLTRITDLILLNILFLISCLPVFTVGAAVTALYSMCFRLMREEYNGIIRPYFQAFKTAFRQATAIWGILLIAGVPSAYYLSQVLAAENILKYTFVIFILILMQL